MVFDTFVGDDYALDRFGRLSVHLGTAILEAPGLDYRSCLDHGDSYAAGHHIVSMVSAATNIFGRRIAVAYDVGLVVVCASSILTYLQYPFGDVYWSLVIAIWVIALALFLWEWRLHRSKSAR